MVVLVSLLFTTYLCTFYKKLFIFFQILNVPPNTASANLMPLYYSLSLKIFFQNRTILSFTNQAKGKEPPCRCTFSKSFQRKIPERHFFDHSSTTDASLAHVQDWGAIFKLVCHDQSISGSQKTLWKTKQKLHFNTLLGGF